MDDQTAAPEAPFWLQINGGERASWSCTPEHVAALVLGFLHSSGYISQLSDVLALEVVHAPAGCIGVRAQVPASAVERVAGEQRHAREHGCGILQYVTCEPRLARLAAPSPLPDPGTLRDAFRNLFAATDAAHPEGGMHAAALLLDGHVRVTCFDVGRHNAVDRAIGTALQEGLPLETAGLLLSARVSGAIALKAARSGLAWVASRSIPTSLAAHFAAAVGLPLIARAGRGLSRESEA